MTHPLPEEPVAGRAIRGDTPAGGPIPALAVPTVRWLDARERDLFLSRRRAQWAFDGRKEG